MFWMRVEAVTYKSPKLAWKEGVRGSTRGVRILLVLREKSSSSVLPNTRGSVRGRRGPRFHLCVGCGLLFGSVFIAAEWHAIWLNDT